MMPRWRWASIVVAVAAVLSGCSSHGGSSPTSEASSTTGVTTADSSSLPTGRSSQRIVIDGVERSYLVYRPEGLPDPAPLVVMLHGGFGSAQQAESSYGWDQQADESHFVVAYPDGLNRAWNVDGGGCCGRSARRGVDDVGFVTRVVEAIQDRVPIDPTRIYVTGMSNGAIMAYTLACSTDVFAAIGPVSGTQLSTCADPAPTSVIHIHGLEDQNIPFRGGQGDGAARIDGPSVESVIDQWREFDECESPVLTTSGPVTTSLAACSGGRAVELITVAGAGHQWPGSQPKSGRRVGADSPSQAINATEVIWQFFNSHHS